MLPSRSFAGYVVRRIAWACLVVYLVMTGIFVLITRTPDSERFWIQWSAAVEGETANLPPEPPLSEQYVDWMTSFVTFDWGASATAARWTGAETGGGAVSNFSAVMEALSVTAAYAIPSTVVAFVLALGLGYYAARRPRSWSTRFSAYSTYVTFSLPNFFLALFVFHTLRDLEIEWFPSAYEIGNGFTWSNLLWLALPTFVLTTHLIAGFFRYARAEAREELHRRYVTLARAKGAGPHRITRHVFRNTALPLVTLFVTELVSLLLVAVFVIEVVFEVPGIGLLAYEGLLNRDIELVMVLTVLFSSVCVLSNLAQDIAGGALDPRAKL